MEEGNELWRITRLVSIVLVSLTYCYFVSRNIPKGFIRLSLVIPVISIFAYLPLSVSSIYSIAITGYFIGWIANFKLLLFAFDKGPLSSTTSYSGSSMPLGIFISVACFPIRIKNNKQKPAHGGHDIQTNKPKSHIYYATEALILAVLLRVYAYTEYLDQNFIIFLYSCHIYFGLEILIAVVTASLPRFLPGLELEPQFNDPYFATSLQDYWGRRWNLMVTNILRPTVYQPVSFISTRIFGRSLSLATGVLATFVVSGLMHELIFFYISRVLPRWEVLCFFILQGVCVGAEIRLKKLLNGKFQLPRLLSGLLTFFFVITTSCLAVLPVLERCKLRFRGNEDYAPTLAQT